MTDEQDAQTPQEPESEDPAGKKPVFKKPVIRRYHQIDQVNAYSLRKPHTD